MDVAGVAVATVLSTAFSSLLVIIWLLKEQTEFRIDFCKLRITSETAKTILAIGIPAALQGAVFCVANIFVQSAVNCFGAKATAGSAIAVNFEYFCYYIITSFGQAATTFTSQNYAAGEMKRCRNIFSLCILYSLISSTVIIVPLVIFRVYGASCFSTDTDVITIACTRIMCILAFEPLCCLYEIPAGAMRGLGHSTLPSVLTITCVCLFRIIWIFTVFTTVHTYQSLFIAFPISWVITSVLMLCAYGVTEKNLNK